MVAVSALSTAGAAGAGRVCLGAIAGAQGVRGRVRIKSFTADPGGVAAYGPVSDEDGGREFRLTVLGRARGLVIARIDGIEDRNAAEALRGTRLYVERGRLPAIADEEEFYHADLLGLAAVDPDGAEIGRVAAIVPVGAGDVLEIAGRAGPRLLVPFARETVPEVDVDHGRIVIAPPADGAGGGEGEE